MNPAYLVGKMAVNSTHKVGQIVLFCWKFISQLLTYPFYARLYLRQCELLGFNSIPIVMLTAFFTGGVLALQTYNALDNQAVAAQTLGGVVALSILRELGPVLASLMVAGRVGAAMAAEIGTMRVTEQIDALKTLATNPIKYLVVPRVMACVTMVPLLVTVANLVGIFGGYLVSTQMLDLNRYSYMENSFNSIGAEDITLGLVKALAFGLIIGIMGCYHGYYSKGGAEGVGQATTVSVVYASVSILVADYFITALMM